MLPQLFFLFRDHRLGLIHVDLNIILETIDEGIKILFHLAIDLGQFLIIRDVLSVVNIIIVRIILCSVTFGNRKLSTKGLEDINMLNFNERYIHTLMHRAQMWSWQLMQYFGPLKVGISFWAWRTSTALTSALLATSPRPWQENEKKQRWN